MKKKHSTSDKSLHSDFSWWDCTLNSGKILSPDEDSDNAHTLPLMNTDVEDDKHKSNYQFRAPFMKTESFKRRKGRTLSLSSGRRTKRLWTGVEDLILVDYVKQYGERSWANVQKITGLSRTGKSCRLRWTDQLHPGLNKGPFTLEEEQLISELQSQFGNKWTIISDYLPGRTDNAIKNYWYNRCKKYYKTPVVPKEEAASSSDTMKNGCRLNQQCLTPPEWIPSSPFQHLPAPNSLKAEPVEFSSIQHVEANLGSPLNPFDAIFYSSSSAENVTTSNDWFLEGWTPDLKTASTASSCFMGELRDIVDPECDDGLDDLALTEGDIVDLWLKSSSSDESLDQEGVCADGAIGNTTEATGIESIELTMPALGADDRAEFPAWLNSPSLDEFFDQQPICQDALFTGDETINSVEATEESTTTVGFENCGTMINSCAIDEALYTMDDFLYQEPFCQDFVLYADYGAIDYFAVNTESHVQSYGWDETSDFWSTPFITRMQMDY